MTSEQDGPPRRPPPAAIEPAQAWAKSPTRLGLVDLATAVARGCAGFVHWLVVAPFKDPFVPEGGGGRRGRLGPLLRLLVVGGFVALCYWGTERPAAALCAGGSLLFLAGYVFVSRAYARAALLGAAGRSLDDTRALTDESVRAPFILPARPLQELALAIDSVRRGDAGRAAHALRTIDEEQLLPDELRLLAAVRALIARATGDRKTASRLALMALPTGVLGIDERMAAFAMEAAFANPLRIDALLREWSHFGLDASTEGALGRVARLGRLKLNQLDPDALDARERQLSAELARAFGDALLEQRLTALASEPDSGYR